MSAPHVYTAISEVMGKLARHGIGKDHQNKTQGFMFRGIDDVYNALAVNLAETKLLMLPRILSREVTVRETAKGGTLFNVVLEVEFDFVSAVDGSKHTIKTFGEAMDSGDKATNKAQSAAYKYAAIQSFCIPTEGDNDPDATTHEGVQTNNDDDVNLATDEMKNKILAAGQPNGWTGLDVARFIEKEFGYPQSEPAPLTVNQARFLFGHVAATAPEVPA